MQRLRAMVYAQVVNFASCLKELALSMIRKNTSCVRSCAAGGVLI